MKALAVPVPEAAELVGLSESLLWRLMADGAIPKVKVGRRTLIRVSALELFLLEHENVSAEPEREITPVADTGVTSEIPNVPVGRSHAER